MTNGVGGEIFAIVCKIHWCPGSKSGEQFGYKDMEESMGPCEDDCPRSILDLLTPTENDHAQDWRRRCRARLERRSRKIEDGDRIRLETPLKFVDGHTGSEFIVEKRGRRLSFRDPETCQRYRITGFRDLAWQLVPVTKVHKTIFA
jgi:hypothetical protein